MNKTYSLSDQEIKMLDELVELTRKETGRGNKSKEVGISIRERHQRRVKRGCVKN